MRLICCSDLHADHVSCGVPRFDEAARALTQAVDRAIAEKVDLFCFLGDLCDPDKSTSVFRCIALAQRAALRLSQARIRSVWLSGNHDVVDDGAGSSTLTPLAELERFGVSVFERPEIGGLGSPPGMDKCPMLLLALPFTPLSHTYDPEEWAERLIASQDDRPLLVLSHLTIPGVVPGEEVEEMPRGRDVVLPLDTLLRREAPTLVLSGHYHRHQLLLERGKHAVWIVGSMLRLTFGEEKHEPVMLEIDWTP